MKVSLTITDERVSYVGTYGRSEKADPYERVVLSLDGDATIVANSLRAIADNLAPISPTLAEMADAKARQGVYGSGLCDPGFPCGDHR